MYFWLNPSIKVLAEDCLVAEMDAGIVEDLFSVISSTNHSIQSYHFPAVSAIVAITENSN